MYVWVDLEEKEAEKFNHIREELGLRSRAEVVRHMIKRYRLKRGEYNVN